MYWLLFIACIALIFFPLFLAFKEKNFWLNHNDLTKQPLFWGAIFWPASASLALGSKVWLNRTLDFSPNGYETFIEISKLPLGVLALTIPVTAVIAAIHRSIQTAKQIEETQVKNTVDLYYAHLKFFIDQLKDNDIVDSAIKVHKKLYPNLSPHKYNITKNEEYLHEMHKTYELAKEAISYYEETLDIHSSANELSKIETPDETTLAMLQLKIYEIDKHKNKNKEVENLFMDYFKKIENLYNLSNM